METQERKFGPVEPLTRVIEKSVYEKIGNTFERVCNLGHNHKRVQNVKKYDLAIIEKRIVPDLWAEAYGRGGAKVNGFSAVDQFGDRWTLNWNGSNTDGMYSSGVWIAADGRRAEERAPSYAGFVIVD